MGWDGSSSVGSGVSCRGGVGHAGMGVSHTGQTMFPDTPTHPSIMPVMSCDVIDMMRICPLTFMDPYFGVLSPP